MADQFCSVNMGRISSFVGVVIIVISVVVDCLVLLLLLMTKYLLLNGQV
jgi:hypothetical protein